MGLAEGGSQPIRPLGYFRSHMPYLEQVCNGWKGEEATPSLTGLWQPYTSDGRSYANELGPQCQVTGRLASVVLRASAACLQFNHTMRISCWGLAVSLWDFWIYWPVSGGWTNHVFSPIRSPSDRPDEASERCHRDRRRDGHLRVWAVIRRHRCRVVPWGYKAGTQRQSKSQHTWLSPHHVSVTQVQRLIHFL